MAITSSDDHHTEQSSSCEPGPERKELKQAKRYDIQNAVLQRLFRPTTPATQDEREDQESSHVEHNREWGETRQKTLQEHEEELKAWATMTSDNETEPKAKAYRHGRCQRCHKFASTTNLDYAEEYHGQYRRPQTAESNRI